MIRPGDWVTVPRMGWEGRVVLVEGQGESAHAWIELSPGAAKGFVWWWLPGPDGPDPCTLNRVPVELCVKVEVPT